MALSGTGLILCGLYAAVTVACILCSLSQTDTKAIVFYGQLPLLPGMAMAYAVGALDMLDGLSWSAAYLLFMPPTLVALYGLGWGIAALLRSPASRRSHPG